MAADSFAYPIIEMPAERSARQDFVTGQYCKIRDFVLILRDFEPSVEFLGVKWKSNTKISTLLICYYYNVIRYFSFKKE